MRRAQISDEDLIVQSQITVDMLTELIARLEEYTNRVEAQLDRRERDGDEQR